jgi:hypothetical protein
MEHFRNVYGVEKLGIFGSTAREENSPDSDLDLLVEFRPGEETFDHYMHLKFFVEDRLGIKADVVTTNALRKEYKERVLEETKYVG